MCQLAWLNPCSRRVRVGGGSELEVSDVVVERNFVEFFDKLIHGGFWKHHEPGLWVWSKGEVALEGTSAVIGVDPGDEGVAAVEGGGWLNGDGRRQVRHEIFGDISYLARQLLVF
jgi:hypothetical protein